MQGLLRGWETYIWGKDGEREILQTDGVGLDEWFDHIQIDTCLMMILR